MRASRKGCAYTFDARQRHNTRVDLTPKRTIFSHPDYTVGSGLSPDLLTPRCNMLISFLGRREIRGRSRARLLRRHTAGRELRRKQRSPCPEDHQYGFVQFMVRICIT